MEGIVIIADTEKALALIKEFAEKNGYQYIIVDENKIKLISSKGPVAPRPYSTPEEKQPPVVEEAATLAYGADIEEQEKLVVNIKNDDELQQIRKILADMNISFQSESDYAFQKQMQARRALADAAKDWPSYDISMDEIVSMVKEARAERYAKQQNKNNH